MPSAIAAISNASASGFTVSGKWRQQFDWAVVEWNKNNTFEHPSFRYLPDGDLSGLVLTYDEERTGCIPFESNLVPTVDWDSLRIWTDESGATPYKVQLWPEYVTPITGSYLPASATMTLAGSPGAGNRVGLALLESHYYYTVGPGDSLAQIAQGVAAAFSSDPDFSASASGNSITLTWQSGPDFPQLGGSNGNRITVYGFAEGGANCWQSPNATFSGGQFPTTYRVTIDFSALKAQGIPTDQVRKLRWTWAADLQNASFQQTEFQVNISNWTVTGANRPWLVAGPGSRRIEDTDSGVVYDGTWSTSTGNYSGSRIHSTVSEGDTCTFTYTEAATHDLYLGTRLLANGGTIAVAVDAQSLTPIDTELPGEDVLVRVKLGTFAAGRHQVVLTNTGPASAEVFIDFLEIAYPSANLPDVTSNSQLALATDWDTYHSQSLAAERTAWLINKLGFTGRVNHYVGAMWFYELTRPGSQYASLTLTIAPEQPANGTAATLSIASSEGATPTVINHLVLPDDTAATVAQALAGLINVGTNLMWANANGNELTLTARAMGTAGNGIFVQPAENSGGFTISAPSTVLSGGIDGIPYTLDMTDPLNATWAATADYWQTDLNAEPRLNRAARDWHAAYFAALKSYSIDCSASFSTEVLQGDVSTATGIVQLYPDGTPVILNTPAIQTNFSPTSIAFWTQAYLDIANLQVSAGLTPYLQSGEVQWWYFPKQSVGMPFYDAYTQAQFQAQYGRAMQVITDNTVDPATYSDESAFLPSLIGKYTASIRAALQQAFPGCRYEVLYPTDTNATPLNGVINFPSDWTPANLTCLKTENFTYTAACNLDACSASIATSGAKGFPPARASHLVGIGDAWTPWMKEVDLAQAQGLESVVLFALDQYCLIGYSAPPFVRTIA
ncbi:MAG: hypothetical protein JO061_19190, partial [Acidobacteriaceae bacterium]|nr:hypothetical protein [Acidobacteriaceae bacterium]